MVDKEERVWARRGKTEAFVSVEDFQNDVLACLDAAFLVSFSVYFNKAVIEVHGG